MSADAIIRPEAPDDRLAIGGVIRAAFTGMPYADGDEAEVVERLRQENAVSVSLVAESEGVVIGQVVISPAHASDGAIGWHALGPLAVLPAFQRRGVGSRLVRAGLHSIALSGANGCILLGNPAYYSRFGFEVSPSNAPDGIPAQYFMVKLIGPQPKPCGAISFHRAFMPTA